MVGASSWCLSVGEAVEVAGGPVLEGGRRSAEDVGDRRQNMRSLVAVERPTENGIDHDLGHAAAGHSGPHVREGRIYGAQWAVQQFGEHGELLDGVEDLRAGQAVGGAVMAVEDERGGGD